MLVGHTSKRCPQANADGGAGAADTGYDAGTDGGESTAVTGGWDAGDSGAAAVKGDWDTAAPQVSSSFEAESSAAAAGW